MFESKLVDSHFNVDDPLLVGRVVPEEAAAAAELSRQGFDGPLHGARRLMPAPPEFFPTDLLTKKASGGNAHLCPEHHDGR